MASAPLLPVLALSRRGLGKGRSPVGQVPGLGICHAPAAPTTMPGAMWALGLHHLSTYILTLPSEGAAPSPPVTGWETGSEMRNGLSKVKMLGRAGDGI